MILSRPAICSSLCALAALVACSNASAAKSYVLKNPKQHCKVHYVKKTETIKKHGHKVKQTICRYIAPKTSLPTKTEPAPPKAPEAVAPIATTTTLTATPEKECKPVEGPSRKISICVYTVTYAAVNSKGEPVPGEVIIKEHVPPSQEERKIAVPSGATVAIGWWASESSLSTECTLNSTINKVEQPSYSCEKQNPREILTAEYVPAAGYLTSTSEPVTLQ